MGKGKLVFKGEKQKSKKKKKSKHSVASSEESKIASLDSSNNTLSGTGTNYQTSQHFQNGAESVSASAPASIEQPKIRKGEGNITSSGTVLMGIDTKFNSCLNVGDAILVKVEANDGTSAREEMRVITMRLSDISASVSSSFSHDLKIPTPFQYIAKPKNVQKERDEREKKERMNKEEIDRSAFGTYRSGDGQRKELVYREVTEHGSYRIRRETVDSNTTRSDLLGMRLQKKSDKFC